MSNSDTVEPFNPYFAGGSRRAKSFGTSTPPARSDADVGTESSKPLPISRPAKQTTARERISAAKGKKVRQVSDGPTPERMAKGDIAAPRTVGGFHRSLSMAERLRDAGEFQKPKPISRLSPAVVEQLHDRGKLDRDPRTNAGMYEAAEKLRRHFEGCGIGVKAQDLNKIMGSSASDDLTQEEAWVHHRNQFRIAVKLMGWSDANPHRGAGRIVVAVVCLEQTIYDAAAAHTGLRDNTAIRAAGMDRLREGLFALATFWRMV